MVSVAVGALDDKTQLLALILAARPGKPVPIIAGILAETLAHHLFPTVLLAHRATRRIPVKAARIVAAITYTIWGALTLPGHSGMSVAAWLA